MNCPQCHSPVLLGARYCAQCGAKLDGDMDFELPVDNENRAQRVAKLDGDMAPVSAEPAQLRIGRSPDNDICLNDDMVSRYHASLFQQADGSWRLKDLSSKNGTFRNGQRITSTEVSLDDQISMGRISVTIAELLTRGTAVHMPQIQNQATIVYNASQAASRDTPPKPVKYIVYYNSICIVIGILFYFLRLLSDKNESVLISVIIYIIFSSLPCFLIYKLYRLRNWARITYITFSSIGIICAVFCIGILFFCLPSLKNNDDYTIWLYCIFGCLFGIIIQGIPIYYLTKADIVACFKKKSV